MSSHQPAGTRPSTTAPYNPATQSRLSTLPSQKARQLSHLHSQLAQLTAHVSDLENLLRMTAVQAEAMRGLGGYAGAMFMASAKVLGEDTLSGGVASAENGNGTGGGAGQQEGKGG